MAAERCVQPAAIVVFLDGNLAEADREKVQRHLASCGRCRALAGEFSCVAKTLGEGRVIEPSSGFAARVVAAAAAPPAATLLPRWGLAHAAAAAALIVGAVVGARLGAPVYSGRGDPEGTPAGRLSAELRSFDAAPPNSLEEHFRRAMEAVR